MEGRAQMTIKMPDKRQFTAVGEAECIALIDRCLAELESDDHELEIIATYVEAANKEAL